MMELNNLTKQAKKAVDEAVVKKAVLLMCVDGYQTFDEALQLRDTLWYAKENGVSVEFVPDRVFKSEKVSKN